MSIAAASPAGAPSFERSPAALLPVWVARLVGFAALALLGVSQWQRMVAGIGFGRPVLWVVLAVAVAGLVVACHRAPGWWVSAGLLAVSAVGLLAAYLAAGLDLSLLKPRRLDELASGLYSGTQALSTVRLPYDGADPWPGLVLQALGAGLVMVSALLAFWPRATGGRGYPFLALAALLVLVAAPVVSLGGTRPLLLGAGLTLLTVCFLWLERLPLRPGAGVAALVGLALAGALPLAAAADRGDAWFDYQAFAEGLGPKDPVRFDWGHGDYGPITWGRSGAEVVRVKARRPAYWKVRTLDEFDGRAWGAGGFDRASDDPLLDLPPNWQDLQRYHDRIEVSVQRMRGTHLVGAGTTLDVSDPTRRVQRGVGPGEFDSIGDLRTGDSYSARVYNPRPTDEQLAAVPASAATDQSDDLRVRVRLDELTAAQSAGLRSDVPRSAVDGEPAESAVIEFPPFGRVGVNPVAEYREYGMTGEGAGPLEASHLARTWALSQRLKASATTPHAYALAVTAYLRRGFTYTERPPTPAPGVAPLDSFLFDTKAGYCQHYSAAMALLLRMGGVPARVATGFSPGGYSKRRQAWIVRDTDAHSWVEAWFDGYGWVTLDPTPAATPARSQIAATSAPTGDDPESAGGEGTDAQGAPIDRRAAGERELLFENLGGGGASEEVESTGGGGDGGLPVWPLAALALVATALAGLAAARHHRRLPADPLDRAILELETALRRSGRGAPSGMTLRQLERRLGLSSEAAGYLRAVSAGRYATRPVLPTNAQRKALRRELSSGLSPMGRLRTFLALPPRPR